MARKLGVVVQAGNNGAMLHYFRPGPPHRAENSKNKKIENIIVAFKTSMDTLDEASLEAGHLRLSRESLKSFDHFFSYEGGASTIEEINRYKT